MKSWASLIALTLILTIVAACGGGGDDDPTPTTAATQAAESTSVETAQVSDATETPVPEPTATTEATNTTEPATATTEPEPTATQTEATEATPSTPPTDAPTETSAPTETTQAVSTVTPQTSGLFALLPTLEDMPEGFAVAEESARTPDEIASDWPDPQVVIDLFAEWGWTANATREFELPSPSFDDAFARMIVMSSSVNQYGSPEQAQAAAQAGLELQMGFEGSEMTAVEVEQLGDLTVAGQGNFTAEGTTAVVALLYVVEGDTVWGYQGVSLGYASLPDILAIAQQVAVR